MAVVVVGGHSRNIGKTSVVAGLIAALPRMRWTAFKVTQFGHGICSADGKPCECETADHTAVVSEERGLRPDTDSGRFLAAGAEQSFWVRTQQGQLFAAMPRVRAEIARAHNAILESNSVLQFLQPDLYLSVLDGTVKDFKVSARRYLDRADAVLLSGAEESLPDDAGLRRLLRDKPMYRIVAPSFLSPELVTFVARRIGAFAVCVG